MQSKWFGLKEEAIKLRKEGTSMTDVESRLGIPRSTLSGWFKTIRLSQSIKRKLRENSKIALHKGRKKAAMWHNAQKAKRLQEAKEEAGNVLNGINTEDPHILELALAMLYLGEGFKTRTTALGNSNSLILKFFLAIIRRVFNVDMKKIRCELHLRADQNPQKMKEYWSTELNIPIENFRYVAIDKRTIGSKTYPHYKGVCIIDCGNVAIQREIVYLGNLFCRNIVDQHSGG